MKYMFLAFAFLTASNVMAQQNYILQIGESSYEMALDSTYKITVQGKIVTLILKQKQVLSFHDSLFSFSYPQGFQIVKTKIETSADQYLALTADGSGFIIQAYRSINPTSLNEIMLRETTKENLNYGYKMTRVDSTCTLASGQALAINKAILTFKENRMEIEVASLGSRDEGIVVITINNGSTYSTKGKELIDMMWHSLRYKK
jgi:hypothetical protein